MAVHAKKRKDAEPKIYSSDIARGRREPQEFHLVRRFLANGFTAFAGRAVSFPQPRGDNGCRRLRVTSTQTFVTV